ncbi:hypothetical protein CASFOL_010831 [Castilleja foliolosa]|uniref:No apical meristem-associated C-terminal domain-containing protein n=1 Tax=Castilleja foliolosa TaxID=1961234 RepID=A0ABD3DTQ3_9LAMI
MAEGRGKSFTVDQDAAICNAYLCITQDPIVGNSQKKEKFWDRILAKYVELTNDSRRSFASIKARWSTIQKACSKFSGILRQIKRQHHSGMTAQNEIDLAKRQYKDDVEKPFPHLDACWEILEHSIKFSEISDFDSTTRLSQMETSSDHVSPEFSEIPSTFPLEDVSGTPTSASGGSVQSPRKRPPGCKVSKMKKVRAKAIEEEDREFLTVMKNYNKTLAEKEVRKAEYEARKAETESRKVAALEKRAEAEKMKVDAETMKAEEQIMTMNLDSIEDPQLRSYYQLRKDQIMEKLTKKSSLGEYFPDLGDY